MLFRPRSACWLEQLFRAETFATSERTSLLDPVTRNDGHCFVFKDVNYEAENVLVLRPSLRVRQIHAQAGTLSPGFVLSLVVYKRQKEVMVLVGKLGD